MLPLWCATCGGACGSATAVRDKRAARRHQFIDAAWRVRAMMPEAPPHCCEQHHFAMPRATPIALPAHARCAQDATSSIAIAALCYYDAQTVMYADLRCASMPAAKRPLPRRCNRAERRRRRRPLSFAALIPIYVVFASLRVNQCRSHLLLVPPYASAVPAMIAEYATPRPTMLTRKR